MKTETLTIRLTENQKKTLHEMADNQGRTITGIISRLLQTEGDREMKKLVEEVNGEGLDKLIGERVTLFCMNYIYTGRLTGVNETCVLLTDAAIVYETGELTSDKWKDAQSLPNDWYVQLSSVESFGILK